MCKRQFFYRYIQKIKEHIPPQDLSRERDIGNGLHAVLEKVYLNVDHYKGSDELKIALFRELKSNNQEDAMMRYLRELWSEKLTPFVENEIQRFQGGNRIVAHERHGSCVIHGITLEGRMDRVENTLDGLEILDYKTGSFADTTREPKEEDVDYQLAAYALMGETFGTINRCGFYDLKSGKVHYEQFLEEKIRKLKEVLETLAQQKTFVWEMTSSHTACRYCPYAILCQREG
jgi:RecB family exonuclease